MAKLVAAVLLAYFLGLPATSGDAARIEVFHGDFDTPTTIFVTGELIFGDDERFINRIVDIDDGIVIFDSPGGNMVAGLEIGRAIRLKGFATLVPDDYECAPACALSWLGGRVRYLAASGRVGFHAAYALEADGPRERGAPNAMIGAYLNWLGLTGDAIFYVTNQPPERMNWLSFESAIENSIEVERWEVPEESVQDGEPVDLSHLGRPVAPEAVAQRAIYYFQGAEGSPGRAVEGSVTWTETMRENNPAVQAILRLAEPEVTTTVTIYRNTDANLPASHMVEVEFVGALGSTAIQRVPALVLKSTEQARGEPLAGAAVPVTDDLFWIALSDDTQEVTRNITLLREGDWFDIPILFTDGTRALLTFEKGIPGDLVFENVLAAWPPT